MRLGFLSTFFAALLFATCAHAATFVEIPAGHDEDLKVFFADGKIAAGAAALEQMRSGRSALNVWVAGNQFFAMPDVIHAYQSAHPGLAVGLITLPPGLVVAAIVAGGWRYGAAEYPMRPDVFGVVDMSSARKIALLGSGSRSVTYMHNELTLMVAKGNPKKVTGLADLRRADLKVMLPNPVSEGIMSVYARKMLEREKLWEALSDGKMCASCTAAANVYFTSVHHREIPAALKSGVADVGIVWATELQNAVKEGRPVEGVHLPEQQSLKQSVSYIAGNVPGAEHGAAADDYLAFLGTAACQSAYASHGFIPASPSELVPATIK